MEKYADAITHLTRAVLLVKIKGPEDEKVADWQVLLWLFCYLIVLFRFLLLTVQFDSLFSFSWETSLLPSNLSFQVHLGYAYSGHDDEEKALEVFKLALATREKLFEKDDKRTLEVISHLLPLPCALLLFLASASTSHTASSYCTKLLTNNC